MFRIVNQNKGARLGLFKTAHGDIKTPFFMPIATRAAVKNLGPDELKAVGAQILLSNTYHLLVKPGQEVIRKAGGLHKFMGWDGPLLTDSGGFQVASLPKMRKIKENGVEFYSAEDGGKKHFLTPERVIKMQQDFGVDVAMVLDVCTPYPCSKEEAAQAVDLTTKWARKTRKWLQGQNLKMRVFAITQGSLYKDLRLKSTKEIRELDFDGYAIGGLARGEANKAMYRVLDYVVPMLPEDKPRYLMGIGKPENIVEAVKRGVDMFDCVIPTREARHGRMYKFQSPKPKIQKKVFYEVLKISNQEYRKDFKPLDKDCQCSTCQHFSRAYLHHLFRTRENLALRLATIHNLKFYLDLMREIRDGIRSRSL